MRYMVIERFREGQVGAIYRRFAKHGQMMPSGLQYIDSWVSADLTVCYQLMQTDDVGLFAQWTRHWDDLVDFEIVPIVSSSEARAQAQESN
jgi:hypothetical protein